MYVVAAAVQPSSSSSSSPPSWDGEVELQNLAVAPRHGEDQPAPSACTTSCTSDNPRRAPWRRAPSPTPWRARPGVHTWRRRGDNRREHHGEVVVLPVPRREHHVSSLKNLAVAPSSHGKEPVPLGVHDDVVVRQGHRAPLGVSHAAASESEHHLPPPRGLAPGTGSRATGRGRLP